LYKIRHQPQQIKQLISRVPNLRFHL